jgi:hypothetical protein
LDWARNLSQTPHEFSWFYHLSLIIFLNCNFMSSSVKMFESCDTDVVLSLLLVGGRGGLWVCVCKYWSSFSCWLKHLKDYTLNLVLFFPADCKHCVWEEQWQESEFIPHERDDFQSQSSALSWEEAGLFCELCISL